MKNPYRWARTIVRAWLRDALAGGWLVDDAERITAAWRLFAGARDAEAKEAVISIVADWYSNAVDDGADGTRAFRSSQAIKEYIESMEGTNG